jgi:Caspase domain
MATKRAAVVVGVNKTGELTPLKSAATGADEVAAWLKAEGFDVVKLTDAAKPVTASAVRKAVANFVKAETYGQLVLYFSGHGYWKNNAELWLLSEAPGNADEAVSFVETVEMARDSGIPHLVLISDACRSIPQTPTGMRVRGSVVFPNNPANTRVQPKIDKLQASLMGAAAYEVVLPGRTKAKTSVFTHCLRRAYSSPDADMVLKVTEGNRTVEVVPNRRLETFLKREVAAVLASVNVALEQLPVIDVTSDDSAYVGKVRRPPGGLGGRGEAKGERPTTPCAAPITVTDEARAAVAAEIHLADLPVGGMQIRSGGAAAAAAANQLSAMRSNIEAPHAVNRFESQTGFTVSGAEVQVAVVGKGGRVDRSGEEHPNEAAVRVWMDTSNYCSVAITFGGGSGTVLPALRGYIGHITVNDGGVSNVSYVPSSNSYRWPGYLTRQTKIERLRSAVAAAARLGALRLGKDQAGAFADRVRAEKQFDPTLGLYAAYAYAEGGVYDEVQSVREYMLNDLGVSLFDVAMLDRKSRKENWFAGRGVVPFCPLLSQGWYYLRPRGMKLPRILESAQDELIQSLWTTFNKKHMRLINSALREGRLK